MEFSGKDGYPLKVESLENVRDGVRLLSVKEQNDCMKASVFIPEHKENFFTSRINDYADINLIKKKKRKNNDLISSIDQVEAASVRSLWLGKPEDIPSEKKTDVEIWLRYDEKNQLETIQNDFNEKCKKWNIHTDLETRIVFPERVIRLISADLNDLNLLLNDCEYVSGFCEAEEPVDFFHDMRSEESEEWMDDLLSRCSFEDNGVSVCILDSGLNDEHKLIAPAVAENGLHTVKTAWGLYDSQDNSYHGTGMAGIAIYNNLEKALVSKKNIVISHKIESVKILPNDNKNRRNMYGYITKNAVSDAEIENPERKRVLCMAVTDKPSNGMPNSWSSAVDAIVSGSEEEDDIHRLFLISAGNVDPMHTRDYQYPATNNETNIQEPGQAWNAVTIGAYAGKVELQGEGNVGLKPIAGKQELSPFSTMSLTWEKGTPLKPEVVFVGGNAASDQYGYTNTLNLSILTTSGDRQYPFTMFNGTSAATAQASNFCARLMGEYPNVWPETIRGLMIQSARWSDEMIRQYCPKGLLKSTKGERAELIRACGYGIPDYQRASECMNNSVNMVVQGKLQPFAKNGSRINLNEMHIIILPWPQQILIDNPDTDIEVRITLSYFIEPSPCGIEGVDRYKYESCGLRFDLSKTNESYNEFKKRVNAKSESEEEQNSLGSTGNNWLIGPTNRNTGSIHSDYLLGSAADYCNSRYVAVYPVGGWWKTRPKQKCYNNKIRYSLIVTLSAPENETLDLYSSVMNEIQSKNSIQV
ncbi:MAG: S8 family peptidase [Solobacterium sp.]|nr:S8 family peptidase [Solobacterium sp.]MCH4049565.1 S8 family peptidase [Solobacterium sp.]MCH4073249.1 S8 family peptidase [Solobacterium sp.]